ncbi:MAG: hypothetical protein ACOY40_17850 [Bacillota bacterium]
MIDDKPIIQKISLIFKTNPVFDPAKYEMVFYGTKEQFRKAVEILEINEIDYSVSWKHYEGIADPYSVGLKVDILLLKQQK